MFSFPACSSPLGFSIANFKRLAMFAWVRIRLAANAFLFCSVAFAARQAGAAAPVIPGFERLGKTDAAAGRHLLGELNCLSCHQPAEPAPTAKQAPVLDSIGTRIRPSYFKKYLSDPQQMKPGSAMPHVFAGDADAASKIEAITHYLVSTGLPRQEASDPKAARAGEDLYHKIGCVACHGTRDVDGKTDKTTAASVPLGDLKAKYTLASLATFLTNPHTARPSGRMPTLLITGDAKAKAKEARELANYLIRGAKVVAPVGKGTTAYRYYEGNWNKVPNLGKLKPTDTGVGAAFDLSVARRHSEYAMAFDGLFRVPADGMYTFTLSSDDGSKLFVDGTIVVDNDGIHPNKAESKATMLTKGTHKVRVTYFQGGGEDELTVDIEGPSLAKQPLGGLVATTEEDLDKAFQKAPAAEDDEDRFVVQGALIAKGKALFASTGCASCHQVKDIKSEAKAPAFAKLQGVGGCLANAPVKGAPWFGLNTAQKLALTAAIQTPPAPSQDPKRVISQSMLAFNCYACHSRDKIGGPEEEFNKSFDTTQREMGDEARIPPPLDNVGGKLNLEYLKKILYDGSRDRPYMYTRMPAFGRENAMHLAVAFADADKGKFTPVADVAFSDPMGKVKAVGRHLSGKQAFNCIACHTFAGNKTGGIQGMDMTLFATRLQRDWFHEYLYNPQKVRPGTRMPSNFDKGKSILPGILDGTPAAQTEALWAYLNDAKAGLPEGAKKQSIPLTPVKDAILYRNFIQGAGNRAIGVGYPEKVNIAFDANEMRLAMIWQGSFIDAGRHWNGRGEGSEPPLGDNILSLPAGSSFAVLDGPEAVWPKENSKLQGFKFAGYHLTPDERPTFVYSLGDIKIEDFPNAVVTGKDAGLRRTFSLAASKDVNNLYFRAAVGAKIESLGNGIYQIDGAVRMKLTSQSTPVIRSSAGKMELIVPVAFTNNKGRIVQEYSW
jgi:mono/diheme cytochrome c family protein